MTILKFTGLIACLLAVSMPAQAERRHFEVMDWCFCRSVDEDSRTPIHCLSDPTEARGNEKLYLWMRISVNENGIRYLRGLHKMPVYHAWGRNGWIEGRVIDIGITRHDWASRGSDIENEIGLRNGSFDWRTYSQKVEYIYDGEHYVSVLDAERRSVVLTRDRYTAFRPSIHVSLKGH
jgi:hypothetical protein